MIKNKSGKIINITSVVGHTGNVGQANYAASKSGIIGMSKSLALEYAKKNININCISPRFIKTNMTEKIDPKFKDLILAKIPSNRLGEPSDVANVAAFLSSKCQIISQEKQYTSMEVCIWVDKSSFLFIKKKLNKGSKWQKIYQVK